MRTYQIALTALFAFLMAGTCMAQTDAKIGKIDVYGIKRIQITPGPTGYVMNLVATFTNANAEALRLKNGDFDVVFARAGNPVYIGETKLVDEIVPGQGSKDQGRTDVLLKVQVGSAQSTMEKLVDIINMIGDPSISLRIDIRGKSDVGLQLPRGWVYGKYEMDLAFVPAIQREFVLK